MTRRRLCFIVVLIAAGAIHAQLGPNSVQPYEQQLAQPTPLARALNRRYARHLPSLRQEIAAQPRNTPPRLTWLDEQLAPLAKTELVDSGSAAGASGTAGCSLVIRCAGDDIQPGQIAQYTIDFIVLEELAGKSLDRMGITIAALHDDDSGNNAAANAPAALVCQVTPLTPDRVRVAWPIAGAARRFRIDIAPASDHGGALPLQRLLGMGDQLMLNARETTGLPGNIWSAKFAPIFGDGKPALIAGRWTDFAHIFQNLGAPGPFKTAEAHHFLARDSMDEAIGTDEHHGLAFSVVDPADVDGDGKIDLFLCRYYNTAPLFARNISQRPGQLDFADPCTVAELPRGWRYAYGDLDGDGLADAVAIQLKQAVPSIIFRKGLGLDAKGVLHFGPAKPIKLVIPDSLETARGSSVCTPSLSLDDLNGDGLLDLSVLVPVFLYVSFNEGTAKEFAFNKAEVVKTDAGAPVECRRYYPFFAWHDINQDGTPDLFLRSVRGARLAKGSVLSVAAAETPLSCLERQAPLNYAGLANFAITDLHNDGQLIFCQIAAAMKLARFSYQDGLFTRLEPIALEAPDAQRYGCPDSTEYGALYAQIRCFDADGDGRLDVLCNTEHNWRLGYFSLYRQLENGQFAPEEQLAPKPCTDYADIVKTKRGKGLRITPRSSLDYLSWECRDQLTPAGGAIRLTFTPNDSAIPPTGRVFFSSVFWDSKQLDASALHNLYYQTKTLADLMAALPGFTLAQLPDGRLCCQLGSESMTTRLPVVLQRDAFYRIELTWDRQGSALTVNNQLLCRSQHCPPPFAERLHLGSYTWMAVQHFREYPDRRKAHPTDFSCPAEGVFTEFICEDPLGKTTYALDLKRDLQSLPPRSAIAYRCTPGVTTYNGQPALIAHFDDNRRTEMPGAKARLHVVPFTQTPGQAPKFTEPIPLRLQNGNPFYAHTRTEVVPVDWNDDGATDIILATENYRNNYNIGVELFLNDGQWHFTRTPDPDLARLNDLMTAHHDIKLAFAPLTNAAEPDIVTWTDPGIRAYSRAFLRQLPIAIRVEQIRK